MKKSRADVATDIYLANPLVVVIEQLGFVLDELYGATDTGDAYILYEIPGDSLHRYVSMTLDGTWYYTDDRTSADEDITCHPATEDELLRWLTTTGVAPLLRPRKLEALRKLLEN